MLGILRALALDNTGATAVEYGLIAALISIVAVVALTSMGSSLSLIFSYIRDITANAAS